ncbi:MAG: hypothetical protein O3A00_22850 [Planctomycetota bacterium]|nr:hypothetical protein [Planctomycetota bacterium]
MVLELDAAFADSSLESADQADPSQELTYVDIDTFLANFSRILDTRQQGTLRPAFGIAPYFACIEGHVALRQAPICLPATRNGRRVLVFQGGHARLGTQAILEFLD